MPPDRGGQADNQNPLRPLPQAILQPTPRHTPARASIFSLTPASSSSSNSNTHSADQSPDPSPERPPPSDYSSTSSNSYSFVSEPRSSADHSPISPSGGMFSNEPRSNNTNNNNNNNDGTKTPPPTKSRSILNLTSSTLFGIYSPTGYDANRDEPETPWVSGAQTPALRNGGPLSPNFDAGKSLAESLREKAARGDGPAVFSRSRDDGLHLRSGSAAERGPGQTHSKRRRKRTSWTRYAFGLVWRIAALFALGMAYGGVVTHLHDTRRLAPVAVQIDRGSWTYLCSWGVLAAALGFLLPWVDKRWGREQEAFQGSDDDLALSGKAAIDMDRRASEESSTVESSGAEWNPIVRSVGAFVGIAFAIRRLPWQSTLQVSLTLALVNPVIWYLLDRTRTGVALSFLTGLTGATAMMGINPDIVPSPAGSSYPPKAGLENPDGMLLGVSLEGIGVATWIGSVFFCSCVCFGNVGRRLAREVL